MTNIKAQYLLKAGLGVLHFETMEWIEKVEFDIHELSVLGLLSNSKKKDDSVTAQKHKDVILNIDTCLNRLSTELQPDLQQHERSLSELLMAEEELNDDSYRGQHEALSNQILKLDTDIKRLKKEVYAFLVVGHHQQRHGFPL